MDANQSPARAPVHLSVILPVFNGEDFLGAQLDALCAQECDFSWELIVVDNGSTDATRDVALRYHDRLPHFDVISEARSGKAHALNAGRAVASGSMIVTVDADDVVGPGYLSAMASALESHDLVCARPDFGRLNPPWAIHDDLSSSDQPTVFLEYLPYVPGGLMGVTTTTWDLLGGFTTDLRADDVDFTWRAGLSGITIGMAPKAILSVRRPSTPREDFRKARGYGRAHVQLFKRFHSQGMPRKRLRAEVGHLWLGARPLLRRDPHWRWAAAWHWGLIVGRLEESIRIRTWYP